MHKAPQGYNEHRHAAFTPLLRFLGALTLIAVILYRLSAAVSGWSPTQTARKSFYYPPEHSLPDRSELAQILLSEAFFGTDALYFDRGEENTGIKELPIAEETAPNNNAEPDLPKTETEEPEPNISDEPSADEPLDEDDSDVYDFDRASVPENEVALIPYDLSLGAVNGEILLSNTTAYSIKPIDYLAAEYPIIADLDSGDGAPLVLIIHTHGTESYSPENAVSVSETAFMRSTDTAENVVAIGELMATMLNEAGIPTLHVKTMHDESSYTRSYDLAADTVRSYLQKYPSIQYVFDVHRDAVYSSDGDHIKPITVINGERCAQVMLVVGTDEKGADHPNWEENFTVAAHLQSRLTATYEKFARPINIRGASFNEQFTKGSLLIEIGSAGNSLSEAKNAAKYLTLTIIELINENSEKKEP